MRGSKGGGIVLAIIGIWALVLGSFWTWSGMSILTGAISADCETIELRAFGAFLGRNGGTCLALEDKSSWGIPGLLAALVVLLVGGSDHRRRALAALQGGRRLERRAPHRGLRQLLRGGRSVAQTGSGSNSTGMVS